jgi:D-alanine-D-alanine ligase
MNALDTKAYDVTPVRIGKDGRWHVDATIVGGRRGERRVLVPDPTVRHLRTIDGKKAERMDIVIPLIHGTTGEDGALQGLLELAEVPYVGGDVTASAIAFDKVRAKQVLQSAGFPVTEYVAFSGADWTASRMRIVRETSKTLGFPCFVKPARGGSSVGVSKAHHRKEFLDSIDEALRYDDRALVEHAVPDAREIECAVLGNADPMSSVLGEIVPSNEFYDYAAKYLDDASELHVPAKLPARTAKELREAAIGAYRALGLEGMARVDFLMNGRTGEWYVNEVNTIPGFTSISMYPALWRATGLPLRNLLDRLVGLALQRGRRKASLLREYADATEPK